MSDSIQHCKCPNCSQGYCHFCPPRATNTVTPIIEHEKYKYLPGCGLVRLPYKHSDPYIYLASACEAHNKGAK